MKKQLTYISPLRAGIVLGIVYAFFSLIFVPFFLLGAVLSAKANGPLAAFGGVFIIIIFPVLYGVAGFIGGLILAAIYNLVAKWTGGLEFQVQDVPPTI